MDRECSVDYRRYEVGEDEKKTGCVEFRCTDLGRHGEREIRSNSSGFRLSVDFSVFL